VPGGDRAAEPVFSDASGMVEVRGRGVGSPVPSRAGVHPEAPSLWPIRANLDTSTPWKLGGRQGSRILFFADGNRGRGSSSVQRRLSDVRLVIPCRSRETSRFLASFGGRPPIDAASESGRTLALYIIHGAAGPLSWPA
jgi:hypothetical protein